MQRIGYILRSYPRLSQTFILNEILALEQVGQNLHLFAITNPREPIVQAQVAAVRAPVEYLEDAGKRGRLAILSEHIRAAAREPLRAKVRLIHHGVNLDSFHPAPSSTRGGGEDLAPLPPRSGKGLGDGGAPLILSVGRLVEKKGFPDLIAACAQLKQAGHRFS